MSIRRVPFSYSANATAHWNSDKPEFSQVVNAASLAMPFLEPYLVKIMREARSAITDPLLREDLDLYIVQEATHSRQHKKFNETIAAAGYSCVSELESTLDADYAALGERRSQRFNLAYAEGFEAMALAIGHMLIEEREYLFSNSDSCVASLVLWHFVEEIEHKNVAFDVFHHLHVFLSIFASLFYLLAFSLEMNVAVMLLISVLVFLVVYIPCCISDIIFPILFIKKPCKNCGHWHD